ncbi:hypothetical protein OGZ02_16600 [Brachyspira hyodysenteriae]|nr:hypothetical protein [Brachyspira hyodysenteriae]MDA1470374.1 hypothetical protein [Brachyspira hyodysenteriae]
MDISNSWNIYKKLILLADVGIDDIKVIENRNYLETTNIVENLINRSNKKS